MINIHPKKITANRVITTSFLVDISDIILNLTAALLSGSVVMTTQTLQGVADLTASGLTLIGIRRSQKPPDKLHPFGYGREIYFWTMLASLLMFTVTAGFSFYLGLQRFLNPKPLEHIFLAYSVLIIAIITNGYSFSQSYRRLVGQGNKLNPLSNFTGSPLVGTKVALSLDAYGVTASAIGLVSLILFQTTGNMVFDGLGAMIIALMLGYLAFTIVRSLRGLIAGQAASPQTQSKIIKVVESVPNVIKVLDLKTSILGPETILVNLEVHLKDGLTTDQIEKLIDQIKQLAQKEVPTIQHIQVELETPDKHYAPPPPTVPPKPGNIGGNNTSP